MLRLTLLLFIMSLTACIPYRFDQLHEHEKNKDEEKLINFLNKSPEAYIRAQAAQSLGRIKSKRAVPSLIKNLNDINWEVRYYCAESLGILGNPKAVKPLKKLIETETEQHVIDSAKKALNKIASSENEKDDEALKL